MFLSVEGSKAVVQARMNDGEPSSVMYLGGSSVSTNGLVELVGGSSTIGKRVVRVFGHNDWWMALIVAASLVHRNQVYQGRYRKFVAPQCKRSRQTALQKHYGCNDADV